jgi:glycosyltransferase involved in cell wall biosynthesis
MTQATIIIPIYNRPEYLERCFSSLIASDLTLCKRIILANDGSDLLVDPIITRFKILKGKSIDIIELRRSQNKGVRETLKEAITYALFIDTDFTSMLYINLDSDAIVKPDWLNTIITLKCQNPEYIVSGFNSSNKNPDGSLKNPIIKEGQHSIIKKHCNGINMCFDRSQAQNYILRSLQGDGNWDFTLSKWQEKGFLITKPSVVQHIGVHSSMGHSDVDIADDFKLLKLPTVTLFGIDAIDPEGIKRAADICTRDIEFGDVQIITDRLWNNGREGYSNFCINEMYKYIKTHHVLIIHPDGYIQNPLAWDNDFLNYDYIGATWLYKDNMNVGNGGFSLRSRKLLEILAAGEMELTHPEDHHICRTYRADLENRGIKYAPEEVANCFSIEAYGAQIMSANVYNNQFGFHGYNVSGLPYPPSPRPNKMQMPHPSNNKSYGPRTR